MARRESCDDTPSTRSPGTVTGFPERFQEPKGGAGVLRNQKRGSQRVWPHAGSLTVYAKPLQVIGFHLSHLQGTGFI